MSPEKCQNVEMRVGIVSYVGGRAPDLSKIDEGRDKRCFGDVPPETDTP